MVLGGKITAAAFAEAVTKLHYNSSSSVNLSYSQSQTPRL
jgi:hypothetical protein